MPKDNWTDISARIREKRIPCEVVRINGQKDKSCLGYATEAHHCLFSRNKNFPWVDHHLNAQPSCNVCNSGKKIADNWVNSLAHFEKLLEKGKRKQIIDWLDKAPEKIKLGYRWKYYWNQVTEGENKRILGQTHT